MAFRRGSGKGLGLGVLALLALLLPRLALACTLVVLGDSLTAGFGLKPEDSFPSQLARALEERGLRCRVINAGVSGDTSAGGLARIDWVLAERPTHLLLELGANDGLRGLPTDRLEANLDAIIRRARERGVRVFLTGMYAPPNWGEAYGAAFAEVYRRLAARYRLPFYPFFLEGVFGKPELMQADGLHPNAQGVREIVRRLAPLVAAWLAGEREAELVQPGVPD